MTKKERKKSIFYPRASDVEGFHVYLISQRGTPGTYTESKIQGTLEWAQTHVFGHDPFPTIYHQAGAFLYSFAVEHVFLDGNKRTALMTTSFFLFLNGYSMDIPDDSADFTIGIVEKATEKSQP